MWQMVTDIWYITNYLRHLWMFHWNISQLTFDCHTSLTCWCPTCNYINILINYNYIHVIIIIHVTNFNTHYYKINTYCIIQRTTNIYIPVCIIRYWIENISLIVYYSLLWIQYVLVCQNVNVEPIVNWF